MAQIVPVKVLDPDLSDRLIEEPNFEQGLMGLAFPPEFLTKKYIYVTYIASKANLVLSRFQVSEDTTQAILASEKVLLSTENFTQVGPTG